MFSSGFVNRPISLYLGAIAASLGISLASAIFSPAGVSAQTTAGAYLNGLGGYQYNPQFTVGETVNGYTPPGILDGIGAVEGSEIGLGDNTVRLLVNHELSDGDGYAYTLENGFTVGGGARISYFDIDKTTRQVVDSGLAFDSLYDRNGTLITSTDQFEFGRVSLDRFCSGAAFGRHAFGAGIGFEDPIYFAGEEDNNGSQWVLDVANGDLWAVPQMGRGKWENWTQLNTGRTDTIAMIGGDDDGDDGAPLFLYVGQKHGTDFLGRNGLSQGDLYVWVDSSGAQNPSQFNGTGSSTTGTWVKLTDEGSGTGFLNGFALSETFQSQAESLGAFILSRPEDVHTNPADGSQVVLASTGRGSIFPEDNWGTTYLIDTQLAFNADGTLDVANSGAALKILYDGDDAGGGQFASPDFGLRSPDNLAWGGDGSIYIQEDRATQPGSLFGAESGEEASIWQLDPLTGKLVRVAQVNRGAELPPGQVDTDPNDLGDWETSGILDVTEFFDTEAGERLLILDIQAHSVRGGAIDSADLVEGGQLGFLSVRQAAAVPEPASVGGLLLLGLAGLGLKRQR